MKELQSSHTSNKQGNRPLELHSPPATLKRKAGRKKFQETRHPIYKGVRHKNGKWVCELRQPFNNKSRIWVGTFLSSHMAARAYDVAALALRGDSASLNFPEFAHLLPKAKSSSIRDIQSAATEAANCFFSESPEEKMLKVVIDEEELFNMPTLVDSMAEGLILTPPAMKRGFNWDNHEQDVVDLNLWIL